MYNFSNITNATTTKQDVSELYNALDTLQKLVYVTQHDIHLGMAKAVGTSVTDVIFQSLETNNLLKTSPQAIEDFVSELKAYLKTLPTIELELAKEPTQPTIDQIVLWIRKNAVPNAIISYTISENIIGGAKMIYNGRYKDETVLNNIKTVFTNKRIVLK